ncbi:hypothetical protein [Kaarinaea lacus]
MCLLLFVVQVRADWINLTGAETAPNIAEVYILDDHVKLVLEVYVKDLKAFEELIPDAWLSNFAVKRPPIEQRMKTFAEERFQVVTDTGKKLNAEPKLVEPRMRVDRQSPFAGMINPYTRRKVPDAPEDKRVLYAEIVYPFQGKPKTLTFIPPLDKEGLPTVSIGFIAYHKAVPIIDFRYLGAPSKVNLNWDDPWYTKFDNPNLKRHHKDALMSFLYIEPYEVRHEILTRVKDLEQWMDLGLKGNEYIEVEELDALKQRIGEFLLTKNTVKVDGMALKPILDRTNYVKVGTKGIQLLEKPERLEKSTAIVGVIITYITDGMPKEATVDWELFSDEIQRVPATSVDPAGSLPAFVNPQDPIHKWTNYLTNYKIPTVIEVAVVDTVEELNIPVLFVVSLILALPLAWVILKRKQNQKPVAILSSVLVLVLVAGIVSYPYVNIATAKPVPLLTSIKDTEANKILESLLKNVYRAFDFRDEQDVYDKLALSIDGDLLADVYLQHRKSFTVQKAGGAQAKVKEVNMLNATAEPVDGESHTYNIKSQWTAMGTVGHWGHVHTRVNQYDAIVKIKAIDNNWKIVGLELLEEKRLDPTQAQIAQAPKKE